MAAFHMSDDGEDDDDDDGDKADESKRKRKRKEKSANVFAAAEDYEALLEGAGQETGNAKAIKWAERTEDYGSRRRQGGGGRGGRGRGGARGGARNAPKRQRR